MNVGELNQRVIIKALSNTQDSFGDEGTDTEVWTAIATVWASVKPLSGRELIQAQQLHAEVTHQVRIRYRRGITTANKLVYRHRDLHILGKYDEDENQTWLILQCVERT